jgi:hypothetical protein
MMTAYVGIDVAFAKNKALPIVACVRQDNGLVPLPLREKGAPSPPRGQGNVKALEPDMVKAFVKDAVCYLKEVERRYDVSIRRVAIDAPSSPKMSGVNRRRAELALNDANIRYIPTPDSEQFTSIREKAKAHLEKGGAESRLPHANQLWMLVGFELFRCLREEWECLEVYPQATVFLLGAGKEHKSKKGAVEVQLAAAAKYTGWPIPTDVNALKDIGHGALHDRLDAYLAAWVASLEENEREPLGNPPDDVIWVPRLEK